MNKKYLGQFNTTNSDYILQGFEDVVANKNIVDPFAGSGELIEWAIKNKASSYSGLDIDLTLLNDHIKYNDSLTSIPFAKFIITNPPYLAKNKMKAEQKVKYLSNNSIEDFYLLAIKRIIDSNTNEGILIVPINFFSAENSDNIRKEFLTNYSIPKVNYFKNKVFDDTTYNVVSFYYNKKETKTNEQEIVFNIYPDNTSISFLLEEIYDYRIAGKEISKILNTKSLKFINLIDNYINKNTGNLKVNAFFNDKKTDREFSVSNNLYNEIKNNIILINCIDTNANQNGWIKAEDIRSLNKDCLVGKITSRNIFYILIKDCPVDIQEKIIKLFNKTLNDLRIKYNSLFLTNFRDNDRKRVSFEFCYKLISYCYKQIVGEI